MSHAVPTPAGTPAQPGTGEGPVLSVSALRKAYNVGKPSERLAISDVSFDVAKGEFVCVVGPSGAGKTTLLRCLSGLLHPTTGEVRFEGTPLQAVPDRLSVVFQDYSRSLFPWLTVSKNVAVPLKVAGVAKEQREARISEVLHAVGLGDVGKSYPWQLSGGMQQRVAIARALAHQPDMLLMDEPFASVDAQTRFDLEDLILQVRAQFGITVVLVTHDIDEAVYLADRVVVLSSPPSVVEEIVTVPLARPRDQLVTRSSETFGQLRRHLMELVTAHH
ncbi:ABC transporter ATP-binding protein [Modestobacter sp. VKM Ac-2986]|uniref:ABC transporter ATP-binding protein n=1 Tax=Modestobacter sp. VKM Ac-2986 TaxID=3004140 RepID=UPI0022AB0A83|nr:ABC transporter ATP-binding protein [Modestobacter sp. VKM Ac-2986]MCZ2827567.1 ABC transporter ATP-binding protein [Modestobacter sp. VKM Ac-2986]